MSVFIVPDGLGGERLDVAAARMTGWSRARLAEHVTAGRVCVDGVVVTKASTRLLAGQMLDVDEMDQPVLAVNPRLADQLAVVFVDDFVVVIDKPPGVAAHPSLGWDGPDVVAHLQAAGISVATSGPPERQGIVQRLDVGTSGLMVVARTEPAYSNLKAQFRQHSVEKVYQTLVQGYPDPASGTIDAPIGRAVGNQWRFAVRPDGRPSVTHYQTTEMMPGAAALLVRLETGRTHQIRVHMAAIRHPVVGDPLYGADPVLAARLGLTRQWLHASRLAFTHPGTGQWVEFESAPPADLQKALDKMRF